jgi:hypothetical protein
VLEIISRSQVHGVASVVCADENDDDDNVDEDDDDDEIVDESFSVALSRVLSNRFGSLTA